MTIIKLEWSVANTSNFSGVLYKFYYEQEFSLVILL